MKQSMMLFPGRDTCKLSFHVIHTSDMRERGSVSHEFILSPFFLSFPLPSAPVPTACARLQLFTGMATGSLNSTRMTSSHDIHVLAVTVGAPRDSREFLPVARTMVTRRRERVFLGWIFMATWHYLPCLSTSHTGTTAAQWTLYSGLRLSWNEASMFCKSLGGHLPILNTKLRWNGFDSTAAQWRRDNVLSDDIWTGLFSPTPGAKPTRWEWDCSIQSDDVHFWGTGEPDSLSDCFCVRYKLATRKLHTWTCKDLHSIVCEFNKGGCRYEKSPLPLLAKTLESVPLTASSADSCWEQCLDTTPTSSGEECVAAEFSLGTCKGYLGDRLLSATVASSVDQPSIVKKCFNEDVNNSYKSYNYDDESRTPRPAGDPCSTNKTTIPPLVPTSTSSSAQPPRSEDTTIQTTREQSSSRGQLLTTEIISELPSETVIVDKSTTNASPTLPPGDPGSDISTFNGTSLTRGSKSLLCPCIKSHPNISTKPLTMNRSATSKYRRRLRSEWGSPSMHSVASSAIFLTFAGIVCIMFVVCDTKRLMGLSHQTRRGKNKSPTNLAID